MSSANHPIAILGTGTMGAGIAQLAASHGWTVFMLDVDEPRVRSAIHGIRKRLDRQVEKGTLSAEQRDEIMQRLKVAVSPSDLRECDLLVEAIVENLGAKAGALLRLLPELPKDAVIASNTSSLSITQIGEALGVPQRVVGMHFFNPAPLMPLVEVIAGKRSSADALRRVTLIAEAWGKTVARCNDTPGFIVNRVARPYYLESFRILEDGYAGVDEIDKAMRDLGGFRMGPFELTDLIGQDINVATTQSIWEQLGKPERLRPSRVQQKLVEAGHLGRKSQRGAYQYELDPPVPAMKIERRPPAMSDRLDAAVAEFASRGTDQIGSPLEKYIFARVLVGIINEAAWALSEKVAAAADINVALKLGTNYPKGPLEWAEEIGAPACGELIDALAASGLGHFAPADSLQTRA